MLATIDAKIGTPVNTGKTATIAAILGDVGLSDFADLTEATATAAVQGGFTQIAAEAVNTRLPASPAAVGDIMKVSTGTGANQLDVTSGVIKANLAQILGTALTETAGYLAAGFKKFFNVAAPTGTVNAVGDIKTNVGTPVNTGGTATLAAILGDPGVADGTGYSMSDNLAIVGNDISTRAAAGDAMALTTAERTAIANEIEAQIIDDTDSEKVLTAITNKIASVNPSLDDLTLAGIATAVRTELALELGRIDAAISSRLAAAGYTAPDNLSVTAIKAKTDNLPADPADESLLEAAIAAISPDVDLTPVLDAIDAIPEPDLSKLDVAVSSRLATSGYTAPANADITSIKNKTDNLPADPADQSLVEAAIAAVAAALAALDTGDLEDLLTAVAAIKLKTDLIQVATLVTIASPIVKSGVLTLYHGDDYDADDGRSITWDVPDSTHALGLTTAPAVVALKTGLLSWNSSTVVSTPDGYTVSWELTAEETTALTPSHKHYQIVATLANGNVATLAEGKLVVK
jgi:hypothetical protein